MVRRQLRRGGRVRVRLEEVVDVTAPMEPVAARRSPAVSSSFRYGLIGSLLVLAAISWWVLDDRMLGMDMGPGTEPGTLSFWILSWVVMMAAMMFPSIAPMVLMHHRIQLGKRDRGDAVQTGATALFVIGYLATWSAAGLLATWSCGRGTGGHPDSWAGTLADLTWRAAPSSAPASISYPVQGPLPHQVPQPLRVPALRLAARPHRRTAHGRGSRRLVRGVLLGTDASPHCSRGDERRVDGLHRRADRIRETPPLEEGREPVDRGAARSPRAGVAFAAEDVPGLTVPSDLTGTHDEHVVGGQQSIDASIAVIPGWSAAGIGSPASNRSASRTCRGNASGQGTPHGLSIGQDRGHRSTPGALSGVRGR